MKLSRQQKKWFWGAGLSVLLLGVAVALGDALMARWRPSLDLSGYGAEIRLSERSLATLTDTQGVVQVASIFPRESSVKLPVGRMLRLFSQVSRQVAGVRFEISYDVDPREDVGRVTQLMAQGAEGPGLLFQQAGRHVFVPEQRLLSEKGGYDPALAEEAIASALGRLSREDGFVIGWLSGHGEPEFDEVEPRRGLSGFRRALENEGYRLRKVRPEELLAAGGGIGEEVKALVVMSPRYPVTAGERAILSDWLDRGGRLLCVLPPAGDAGLGLLLEQWGIRVGSKPRRPESLTTGDVGLTGALAAGHAVTGELLNRAQVAFCAPRMVVPVSVRGVVFTSLVQLAVESEGEGEPEGLVTVLAAAERGSSVGPDLAFRPGRLVVLGEAAFLENAQMLNHATANRDLAVNVMHWLTGVAGSGASGSSSEVLRIGQDRRAWRKDYLVVALLLPLGLCWLLWILTRRRA